MLQIFKKLKNINFIVANYLQWEFIHEIAIPDRSRGQAQLRLLAMTVLFSVSSFFSMKDYRACPVPKMQRLNIFALAFSFLFAVVLFLAPTAVYGATEFVSIIDPDDGEGTDYTSLHLWDEAVKTDLTAANTLVFAITGHVGTTTDLATITGQDSGATGTVLHLASTTGQVLIEDISGTFLNGEVISTGFGTSTITATGTSAIAVATCRSTGGTFDTAIVLIGTGWTTSADNYIKIWTDPDDIYGRHNGVWSDEKYTMSYSGGNNLTNLGIVVPNVVIDGLQFYSPETYYPGFWRFLSLATAGIVFKNNIFKGERALGLTTININSILSNVAIYNNIAIDVGRFVYKDKGTMYVYNNTVINPSRAGIEIFAGKQGVVYNNIVQNCDEDDYIFDESSDRDYNISSDDTATGANSKSTTTVQFLDAVNGDYHLHPDDTAALNAGTTTSYLYDIDGAVRSPLDLGFDIGADESGEKQYRSVGNIATDISNSATVTISSSTKMATFSSVQPDNVGVGDVIQYGSTGAYKIVIINGRSSPTAYSVETPDWEISGHAATTSANVQIFRAHIQLLNWEEQTGTRVNSGIDDTVSALVLVNMDLVAGNTIMMVSAYASDIGDTTSFTIDGWATEKHNYIKIYTPISLDEVGESQRHSGVWDDNKYTLKNNSTAVSVNDANVKIDGLQISTDITTGLRKAINFSGTIDESIVNFEVSNNILRNTGNSVSAAINMTSDADIESGTVDIYNNIIYDRLSAGIANSEADYDVNLYNNTIVNSGTGISIVGSVVAKNNLVQDCTDGFSGTFDPSSDNNISDIDGNAPNATFSTAAIDINFADAANNNFHLDVSDTAAINTGFDITASTSLFTTDIDGLLRSSDDLGWDIGADEVATKQYRSIGNDSSDLSNSATVTVSSTTKLATFSVAQPDEVGVGDVVQYGSPHQLAFITGRASSTTYGVQAYNTSAPIATTSASMGIYRAYLKLDDWEDQLVSQVNSGIDDTVDDLVLVNQDLIASDTVMMVAVYASDAGDYVVVNVDGWTTGAQNYIKIYTPTDSSEVGITQRHSGVWDDSKYTLKNNSIPMSISDANVKIDGLQISTDITTGLRYGINFSETINEGIVNFEVSNNIIRSTNDSKGAAINARVNDNIINGTLNIYNNIIYDRVSYAIKISEADYSTNLYNNTIVNSGIAVYVAESAIAKNNLVQNCTTGFSGSFAASSDNNISDIDGNAPNATFSTAAIDINFADAANNDYHLIPDNSVAIDAGTSTVLVDISDARYDINGDYRRTFDIGADETSVEFVTTIEESDGDFSRLLVWEDAIESDLIATTTVVFLTTGETGTFVPGEVFVGQTSGAMGTLVALGSSSKQMLLVDVQGDFIVGEVVADGYGTTTLADVGNSASAVAKIDGAWTIDDDTVVVINDWITGPDNYIKIYTTQSARHNGVWSDEKYRLVPTSYNPAIINILEPYVIIDGLQLRSITEVDARSGLQLYPDLLDTGWIIIKNNIVKGTNQGFSKGINLRRYTSDYYVYNNIVMEMYFGIYRADGDSSIYNNTVLNSSVYGIYSDFLQKTEFYNNIVQGSGEDDYNGTFDNDAISNYNISSDTTAPGANSKSSTIVQFLDASSDDYHLHPDDASALDSGTTTSYLYDIDGTARGNAFDIGADELPVEYVSTICENTSAGGDCVDLDYKTLTAWEDAVKVDLSATTTRIFSGSIVGSLAKNNTVTLYESGAITSITADVVATTSDQILLDNIDAGNASSTLATIVNGQLLGVSSSSVWQLNSSNYWTVVGTDDELGASPIVIVKIDGVWAGTTTNMLTIANWKTDTDNYIKIYTTDLARHDGGWSDDKFRMGKSSNPLHITDANVKIDGLQIYNSNIGTTYQYGILVDGAAIVDISVSNSIIKGNLAQTEKYGAGIVSLNTLSGSNINIWNNIIYDFKGDSDANAIWFASGDVNAYIYNNTIYNNDRGINRTVGVVIAKNNAIFNNANDFSGTFDTLDYNASDDLDGDHAINISPGPVEANGWVAAFSDYANNDVSIRDIASVLYDSGTTIVTVTDDIIGTARPHYELCDLGAFEFSNPKPRYRFSPGGTFNFKGDFQF